MKIVFKKIVGNTQTVFEFEFDSKEVEWNSSLTDAVIKMKKQLENA